MPELSPEKRLLLDEIENISAQMKDIASAIFDEPELGYQEFKSSARLADFLEANGFRVERNLLDMPTAFHAVAGSEAGPKVAFLAEFDALPGLGHACGHNLFGMAACGAAVALARHLPAGSVHVFGTPAEEGNVKNAGGKVPMSDAGLFDDMDAVIAAHAEGRTILKQQLISRANLEMDFHGKAAHAAGAPEKGINAMDAAALAVMGINSLRQHMTHDVRIHGLLTDTGTSINTIPEFARLRYGVRARRPETLDSTIERVVNCARCCAEALGCTFSWRHSAHPYYTMRHNMPLLHAFAANLDLLGESYIEEVQSSYSTDMGNVSFKAPSIHPYISIGGAHLVGHTPAFAEACRSEGGNKGMFTAAKAMAMTGYDVITDPELRKTSRDAFNTPDVD
ncbi:amidohydrolase [Mailhella massiliensis]|uniref:amidohydrolase n=1 Tax=Mailhella massiliensis TaxID=1903261 RepID=UPI0023553E19|nr:amidohydrolase [Mailhella massiliensis]